MSDSIESNEAWYDYVKQNAPNSHGEALVEALQHHGITKQQFLDLSGNDEELSKIFYNKRGHMMSAKKFIKQIMEELGADDMNKFASNGPHSPTDQPPSPSSSSPQTPSSASDIRPKLKCLPSSFHQLDMDLPRRQKIARGLSLKLHDVCQQVEVGPPAVYKLEPQLRNLNKKCNIVSYAMNYGEFSAVDQDALHKVLMIVGATGAGKSTMINALTNHFLGVTFSDPYRYVIRTQEDEGGRSQTHSQTSWVKAYTFPKQPGSPVPYALTIIDTPGYGDTEGIARDLSITQQIKHFFESKEIGIDHINAIAFVVKASDARLTTAQNHIFKEILKVFGKDIEPGIMILATHADGTKNEAEHALKEARVPVQEQLTFLINNGALFESNVRSMEPDDSFDNSFVDQSEIVWKRNEKAFVRMDAAIGNMKDISLWQSLENLREREALVAVLESIGPKIKEGVNNAHNMKELSAAIKEHENEMDKNKDYTIEVKETAAEKVRAELENDQKSLNCQKCETTCHFPCTTKLKRMCKVISFWGNKCSVCTEKCPAASHSLETFKYETRYVEKKRALISEGLMEFKYLYSKVGASRSKRSLAELKNEQQKLFIQNAMLVRKAKECIDRIRAISLNPSPTTEEDYIDLMITNEQSEMEDGWQGRIDSLQELKKVSQLVCKIDCLDEDNGVALLKKELGMDTNFLNL